MNAFESFDWSTLDVQSFILGSAWAMWLFVFILLTMNVLPMLFKLVLKKIGHRKNEKKEDQDHVR